MIELNVLLYLTLGVLLGLWAYDHFLFKSVSKGVMKESEAVTKKSLEMAKAIHAVHNQQAEQLIKIGNKLEELSNKIELSSLYKSGKMFNENKPK